jgi:hypothetical protein
MNRRIGAFLVAASMIVGTCAFAPQSSRGAVLANWTFETSIPTTAGPHAAEVGTGNASGFHASGAVVYSNPAGNGSVESFSANEWQVNDYWQFTTTTTGFQNITIQWDQTSSNTGPRDFQLAWSTDGTNFTNLGAQYQVLPNAAPNPVWNATTASPIYTFGPVAAPAALDDQASIFFRLFQTSTVSANGGTVATAGTDRIDNVIISGDIIPEPASLGLLAAGIAMMLRRRA